MEMDEMYKQQQMHLEDTNNNTFMILMLVWI